MLISLLMSGCATTQLTSTSLNQGSTVTEFEYRMILDNLAMFRKDKDGLPWHLQLTSGTTQVDDSVSPSASFVWPPTSRTLGLSANRGITVNWSVTPTLNDEQLGALRGRYRHAAENTVFKKDFEEGPSPPGDRPFGEYHKWYVWPQTNHLDALIQLVLDSTHDILVAPADEKNYAPPKPAAPGVALSPRR
jgi:hypothetical protein